MSEKASSILLSNLERERCIKELKESSDAKLHGPEIAELSIKVRQEYRKLIVQHTSFLSQEKRDVDGLLWKNCFYKRIEEFRRSLKKHTPELNQLTPYTAAYDKHCLFLSKLSFSFKSFLSESVAFYQEMMTELEERVKQRSTSTTTSNNNTEVATATLRCVYRCLLYLGDLERYKELYSGGEPKAFNEAEQYYVKATISDPSSGNAHNQLAVLATYNDSEIIAVYRYCRSILVRQPFTGGFENLRTLFSKNNRAFASLKETRALFDPNADSKGSNRPLDSTSAAKVKNFITKFIKLHGFLFDWTVQMHKTAERRNQPDQSSSHSPNRGTSHGATQAGFSVAGLYNGAELDTGTPLTVDKFLILVATVLEEFEHQLIGTAPLSSTLLLRLLCICFFSIHHAVTQEHNMLLNSFTSKSNQFVEDKQSSKDLTDTDGSARTSIESLGLIMLFGLVHKVAARINLAMAYAEKGCKPALNRLLPALSVFCDWASAHSNYLLTPSSSSSFSSEGHTNSPSVSAPQQSAVYASSTSFYASTDLLRQEARMRTEMRSSLSSLVSILEKDMDRNRGMNQPDYRGGSDDDHDDGPDQGKVRVHFLREHVELRGFLPLATRYEERFVKFDPIVNTIAFMGEEVARYHRENNIVSFVSTVLLPVAGFDKEKSPHRDRERGSRSQRDRDMLSGKDRNRDKDRDRDRDRGGRQRKDKDTSSKSSSSTSTTKLSLRGRTTNWEDHRGAASAASYTYNSSNSVGVAADVGAAELEFPPLPVSMFQDSDTVTPLVGVDTAGVTGGVGLSLSTSTTRVSPLKKDKSYREKLQGAVPSAGGHEGATGEESSSPGSFRPTRTRGPPAMLSQVEERDREGRGVTSGPGQFDSTGPGTGGFPGVGMDDDRGLDISRSSIVSIAAAVIDLPATNDDLHGYCHDDDDDDIGEHQDLLDSTLTRAMEANDDYEDDYDDLGEVVVFQPAFSRMRVGHSCGSVGSNGSSGSKTSATVMTSINPITSNSDISSTLSALGLAGGYDHSFNALMQASRTSSSNILNNIQPSTTTQLDPASSTIREAAAISMSTIATGTTTGASDAGSGTKFSDMFGQQSFDQYWQAVELGGLSSGSLCSYGIATSAVTAGSGLAGGAVGGAFGSTNTSSASTSASARSSPLSNHSPLGSPLFLPSTPLPPGLQHSGLSSLSLPQAPPGLISQSSTPSNTAFNSKHNSSSHLSDYQPSDSFGASLDYHSHHHGAGPGTPSSWKGLFDSSGYQFSASSPLNGNAGNT